MNAIVETLNTAGRAFVDFCAAHAHPVQRADPDPAGGRRRPARKVRAVFRYWIWMLVLVKLVLPPSLWSPVSIGTWFGDTLEVPAAALLEAPPLPSPAGQDAPARDCLPPWPRFFPRRSP